MNAGVHFPKLQLVYADLGVKGVCIAISIAPLFAQIFARLTDEPSQQPGHLWTMDSMEGSCTTKWFFHRHPAWTLTSEELEVAELYE